MLIKIAFLKYLWKWLAAKAIFLVDLANFMFLSLHYVKCNYILL